MKTTLNILFLLLVCVWAKAQNNTPADVQWGNTSYYNLNIGESLTFNNSEITLLKTDKLLNTFKVGNDTIQLKVSKRSLPVTMSGLRLFVADNKNLKNIAENKDSHGLLQKDVLLCISNLNDKMLNQLHFIFPVSFNDGFQWSGEEDTYMFSFCGNTQNQKQCFSQPYEGIGIDLHDARGIEKHWIVALENTTVEWVEHKKLDEMDKKACVLLRSESNPNIFYVYDNLYNKNLEVKEGQKLMRGQLVGTAWGNEKWGHVKLAVIYSETVPSYQNRFINSVNFFPHLYELYYQQSYAISKVFTRGSLEFGRAANYNRNNKNSSEFEEYMGKGWLLGDWNIANKVEHASKGAEGNVRLSKVLFKGKKVESTNPNNFYDFEVNVRNGVYRIRAKVGDLYLPSWQKVEFEGVEAAEYTLEAGEQKWTNERVVKITDRKITIRIYTDKKNKTVAGLSEIVFQRAY